MGGHNGHDSGSAHGYDKGERSPREAVREGQQMGIKELGRRAKEGLDELMRIQQQRLEEEKNWGFPSIKFENILLDPFPFFSPLDLKPFAL